MAVNAKIEYIEGYSGHADQEWLMNFIYSFKEKPKNIFLVHGDGDSQEILKNKIENEIKIDSIIPGFGETYELDTENVYVTNKEEVRVKNTNNIKIEAKSRLAKLLEQVKNMEDLVTNNLDEVSDEKVLEINEKMKNLQEQMIKIVES